MIAGACIKDISAAHRIARRTVTADDGVQTAATADQCGRTAARLQELAVTTASNEFVGALATVDAVRALAGQHNLTARADVDHVVTGRGGHINNVGSIAGRNKHVIASSDRQVGVSGFNNNLKIRIRWPPYRSDW